MVTSRGRLEFVEIFETPHGVENGFWKSLFEDEALDGQAVLVEDLREDEGIEPPDLILKSFDYHRIAVRGGEDPSAGCFERVVNPRDLCAAIDFLELFARRMKGVLKSSEIVEVAAVDGAVLCPSRPPAPLMGEKAR